MNCDAEQTNEPTIDTTLAIWEKLQNGRRRSKEPGWATNGFETLVRIRELVRHERGGQAMKELIGKLGMENESPIRPIQDSEAYLEFLIGIHGAYLVDKCLRSRGIDPATL